MTLRALPALADRAITLLPSQAETLLQLKEAVAASPVVAYSGQPGMGRSTLARQLAQDLGGALIDEQMVLDALRTYPPLKWDEAVYDLVAGRLRRSGTVVFDGYAQIAGIRTFNSPLFRDVMMRHLQDQAIREGQRLVLVGSLPNPWETVSSTFGDAAALVRSESLVQGDYRAMLTFMLGEQAAALDFELLFRAAPMLDCYQLIYWARLLETEDMLDTEAALRVLADDVLASNIRIGEVERLEFSSLPGSEHIAEELETHIVLPFENRELAGRLGIKPRRGVLLYGPPGTGKTSIGRALAHRMKGRFFLIDGTFVTEPPSSFFAKVSSVVKEAKENAPSVLFIDDADVLFGIEHIAGLSRYLLSLLDGLESESASNVCVMMTAMDAKKVPEALLRSGRVELWLETKAPDAATRGRILERWTVDGVPGSGSVDYEHLAQITEGFTPADLRRLASDAKLLYAADKVAGNDLRSATAYLEAAVEDLATLRHTMAAHMPDLGLAMAS